MSQVKCENDQMGQFSLVKLLLTFTLLLVEKMLRKWKILIGLWKIKIKNKKKKNDKIIMKRMEEVGDKQTA